MAQAVAIDIGGTKTAVGLVDHGGNVQNVKVFPTHTTSASGLFEQVCTSIENLLHSSDVTLSDLTGIGVGVPGIVDVKRGIATYQANISLAHFPLRQKLAEKFATKVVIDNDVYMATFAEWYHQTEGNWDIRTFIYLTVSTGISCGIIDEGKIFRGVSSAGEIGHCVIKRDGPKCKCGKKGCLEGLASGPAIARRAQEKLFASVGAIETDRITTEAVFHDYSQGKSYAIETIDEVMEDLGYALHLLLKVYDPDKIVIGGGVMNNNPTVLSVLQKKTKHYLSTAEEKMTNRINLSRLQSHAGLIGAGLSLHHRSIEEFSQNQIQ